MPWSVRLIAPPFPQVDLTALDSPYGNDVVTALLDEVVSYVATRGPDGGHMLQSDSNGTLLVKSAQGGTLNTGQLAATTVAQQLIGANSARFGVVVTNTTAVNALVASTSGGVATGHIIPAGQSLSLPYSGALWAALASGTGTLTYAEVSQ